MNASEIRERWVDGANYGAAVAVRGEIAAQLAQLVRAMKTFVVVYSAIGVTNSKDPMETTLCVKHALELVMADEDAEDKEPEPEQPQCEDQCAVRRPGEPPGASTSWGFIAGTADRPGGFRP